MAIELTTYIPTKKPYLAHPEFNVKGICSDFVTQEGNKFEGSIYIVNDFYNDGDTITFTFGDHTIVMTLSNTVDPSDYGTLFISNSEDFPLAANQVLLLATYFEFVLDFSDFYGTVISIYARNYGEEYNLDITVSTGAISFISTTPAVNVILNNDINVLCDVFMRNENAIPSFKKVGNLKSALVYNPLGDGSHFLFNFAEFFAKNLKFEALSYAFVAVLNLASDSCAKFKLVFSQSDLWPGALTIDYYTILLGGITKRDYLNYSKDYFANYTDSPVWRLINHVRYYSDLYIKVCKNQIIYTSIFIDFEEAAEDFQPKVTITDINGDSGTTNLTLFPVSVISQNKFDLRLGYTDLGLAAKASALSLGPVKSWSVYLDRQSTMEEYLVGYFELTNNDYREQFFIFRNSKGGLQNIRTIGQHELGVSIDKAEFEKTIPELNIIDEDYMVSETYNHTFKGQIFSGWLNKEDIYSFLDFLNSPAIWIQDDLHARLMPVKILKGSWSVETTSNNGVHQYGFNFEYIDTAIEKHVTDLIPY